MRIFKCKECNEFIFSRRDVDLSKADSKLEELIPNISGASKEKHLPLYESNGRNLKVYVGEIMHPMDETHYIAWILLETNKGVYKVDLSRNESSHTFTLSQDEKVVRVYAYCNLHGLWLNE